MNTITRFTKTPLAYLPKRGLHKARAGILLAMLVALSLILVACGGSNSTEADSIDSSSKLTNLDTTNFDRDTTPPRAPKLAIDGAVILSAGRGILTKDNTPTLNLHWLEVGAKVDIFVDGSDTAAHSFTADNQKGTWTASNLSDGLHTFVVKVTDSSSNESSASIAFTVDTVAPIKPKLALKTGKLITHKESPTFVISNLEAKTSYRFYLDNSDTHFMSVSFGAPPSSYEMKHYHPLFTKEKAYVIRLEATDYVGLKNTTSITVTYDAAN